MRKKIVVGILAIMFVMPVIVVQTDRHIRAFDIPDVTQTHMAQSQSNIQGDVRMTCYIGGRGGMRHISVLIPVDIATQCSRVFHELKENITSHPFSEQTQQLKEEFVALLVHNNLIPASIPPSRYNTLLNPPWVEALMQHRFHTTTRVSSPVRSGIASAVMCDLSGEGTGLMFPFIMLPRPRLVMVWMGLDGDMAVGKFLTIGGFIASGQQFGTALGFWGIGFAVAYPEGNIYGFAGYALFVTVTADQIDSYPPNQAPVITGTDPVNNELNVPLTLPELSFTISDPEGDLMSYTVTTSPDIGSGSGNLKPSGTYTVPIHGLQDLTQYSWTIAVSDTQHTTQQTFTFTTQAVAPIVSNPIPADGEHHVPTDLQQLKFTLKDYQGDTMNYTVETSPFIGSGSGTNVHDGTFSVLVSGLQNLTTYHWYVNATDGSHWTHKTFGFQTWFPAHFDPFQNGWHYRKQITIDHTSIPEDLTDFPVLVSTVDSDLKVKAQADGDDIIFMDNTGYATLLNYEIEKYDGSSGTLIAWVNITQISSVDDTIFYMYYGNPTTFSLQNPGKTWDSNYVGVWHFGEQAGQTVADSTTNTITGTASGGAVITTGVIGNARNFDGSSGSVNLGSSPLLGGMSAYTIEAWVNPSSISGETRIYDRGQSGNPNRVLFFQDTGKLRFQTNNNDNVEKAGVLSVGTWYDVVGTFIGSGGEIALYANGVKVASTTSTQAGPTGGNIQTYIGATALSSGRKWHGTIDEVRFSKIARSAGWISTEYQNQNDPADFLFIGPEQPGL